MKKVNLHIKDGKIIADNGKEFVLTRLEDLERLQEQLKEAQNLIIYTANGHDHLFAQIKCEDYMHKYHLPKWGVK